MIYFIVVLFLVCIMYIFRKNIVKFIKYIIKNKIIVFFIIILFTSVFYSNVIYAGFFPVYQYVEIDMKNYKNNSIEILDENNNVLETNNKGNLRLKEGIGESGSLIIEKGSKIIIDNLYSAAQDVENDCINSLNINITNNKGTVDTISCNFTQRKSKYIYVSYDCDNGQYSYTYTGEKDRTFFNNNKIIILSGIAIIIIAIISIVCIKRKSKKAK